MEKYKMQSNINLEDKKTLEDIFLNEAHLLPLVDIYEQNDEFILTANMPGVEKDNAKIKLEDGYLTISGKKDTDNLNNRKYFLNEIPYGTYYREFKLSDTIDSSKIEGKFENGQLIVRLPKSETAKSRVINIS